MKTFNTESQSYKVVESWLDFSAEKIAGQIAKIEKADRQITAIDTMHAIINRNPEKYFNYSRGTSLAASIRQEQRNKVERFGANAYTLSQKQIDVIAREIAELAAQKVEA